jgi:hypothetical protein
MLENSLHHFSPDSCILVGKIWGLAKTWGMSIRHNTNVVTDKLKALKQKTASKSSVLDYEETQINASYTNLKHSVTTVHKAKQEILPHRHSPQSLSTPSKDVH